MESQLMPSIMVLDTIVHKLLLLNHPTDILKSKLNQMESLVMQIPSKQSELAKYWANKLALHWTVYGSSLLLPALQVPTTDSSSLSDKPGTVRFGTQQTETNRQGSRVNLPLKSMLIRRPLTSGHSHSDCNAKDLNRHEEGKLNETKRPSNLYGFYQPCVTSNSSTESTIDQECTSKQTYKLSIIPTIPLTTSNKNGHANPFVCRPYKRTLQNLGQSVALSSSSSLHQLPKRPRNVIEKIRLEMKAILGASRPVGANDIQGLKGLLRTVNIVIRHLNKSFTYYNQELQLELFGIAFNKLPETIRANHLESVNANKTRSNDLNDFKYFLKGQIIALLMKIAQQNATSFSNASTRKNSTTEPTSATLKVSHLTYCLYCKRTTDHLVANCPVIKIIKSICICFYCLEDGHFLSDCPKKRK